MPGRTCLARNHRVPKAPLPAFRPLGLSIARRRPEAASFELAKQTRYLDTTGEIGGAGKHGKSGKMGILTRK